ncbi:MAG: hypothetical protein AB7L09_12870 [Nitrospira sp.]
MSLKEIIDSLHTEDLVGKFKKGLEDTGVEIAEDPVAKYFAAKTENVTLFLLAHESNLSKGWWGIHHDIVDRVRNSEPVKANHIGWGAVLLHKTFQRGYWIKGDDIFQLKTLRAVTLGKGGQYHFNQENLDALPNLAKQFFSIKTFLLLSGLRNS